LQTISSNGFGCEGLIFETGHPKILIITTNNFNNPPLDAEKTLKAPPF
jgi:hypothetical protein